MPIIMKGKGILKSFTFLLIFMISLARGQKSHELGFLLGSANDIGDVGSVSFFNINSPSYGIFYRFNKNSRISYRLGFSYLNIHGDDKKSNIGGRKDRGYAFNNAISELFVGLEFNFKTYLIYDNSYSPYVFTGLAYDFFDTLHYENARPIKNQTLTSAPAVPIGLGIKASADKILLASAELGVRYLFSDNLDGNTPPHPFEAYRFGNINTNDLYIFLNISLSVRLNKKPCFSCE